MASTAGVSAPSPLAISARGKDAQGGLWLALGVLGLGLALVLSSIGFGDLESRYAIAPLWFCAPYAAALALSAIGFLNAAARHARAHAVPYAPALYLFPVGVIDARTSELAVHRLTETSGAHVDTAKKCLTITLEERAFEFPTTDLAHAERAARSVIEIRDRLANAGPESSAREQSLLDPLLDNGFKNPFSPAESLRRVRPWWAKVWPLLAVILGVLLGGACLQIRNHASEARLYARARASDSAAVYRTYLARGGRDSSVASLLLPRAELRAAVQRGTVSAVEQFRDAHPQTQIKSEVEAALGRVLESELAKAQGQGTLSALADFGARYARYSFLTPALDRAVEARIQAALNELKPALAQNQSHLLPFLERLFRYTAKHGPEVLVRFQLKPSETLAAAETALRKSPYFSGEASLPSRYLDAAHEAPREAAVAAALTAALNQHLPRDLVQAQAGPPLEANADIRAGSSADVRDEAGPTVPTLRISYHPEMSGAFTNRVPRFVLSGIGLLSRASFEIPNDSDPLTFKISLWRAPDLKSITETSTPEQVYDAMATDAFKRFTKKYLATLFVDK